MPCQANSSTQLQSLCVSGSLPAAKPTAASAIGSRQTLFIDARKLGYLVDRIHRDLSDEEIARIAGTYQAWRGEKDAGKYADIPGFCNSATTEEIAAHGYILTPGRYVGAGDVEEDDEPFEEKMKRLATTLEEQFAKSGGLEAAIRNNLKRF